MMRSTRSKKPRGPRGGPLLAVAAGLGVLTLTSIALAEPPQTPDPPQDEAGGDVETALDTLREGRARLTLRHRYEHVDDDAFARDAQASTLRTTVAFESGRWSGFDFMVEAENVSTVGGDAYANAGAGHLSNGVTDRPVVADPALTQINQGYVRYTGEATTLRLGRQEILLDDQRFVGNVGWRQHHQSFDAVWLDHELDPGVRLSYGYIFRVHRIFGDTQNTGSHLIHAAWSPTDGETLTGYGYLLDYDDAANEGLSRNTFGVELRGSRPVGVADLRYEAEYAHQRDAGGNPGRVRSEYLHVAAGVAHEGYSGRVGFERLEGNAVDGQFLTPLATLHAFNGWADKFLRTPVNGLDDLYVRLDGPLGPVLWTVVLHDFGAATGDADYGRELDFDLRWSTPWDQLLALKGAVYDAEEHVASTTKMMAYTVYAF